MSELLLDRIFRHELSLIYFLLTFSAPVKKLDKITRDPRTGKGNFFYSSTCLEKSYQNEFDMSRDTSERVFRVSDSNQAVQPQKIVRGLNLQI